MPISPANDNLDKVNDWLKNAENINPFESIGNKDVPSCSSANSALTSEGTSSKLSENAFFMIDPVGSDKIAKMPVVNLQKNNCADTSNNPESKWLF